MEDPHSLLEMIREEAMKVHLHTPAVPVIGSMLPRVLVVALLAPHSIRRPGGSRRTSVENPAP
jgi:hypothetical protein